MKKLLIGSLVLIILIIVGISWYWWYNTPHVILDRSIESSIFVGKNVKYVRTLNITYRDDKCTMNEMEFLQDSSRDDVISMFSSEIDNMEIVEGETMNSNYDKLLLRIEKNGIILDAIVLYDSNKILLFWCERGNEEYVSRWFVEEYY